ncbi:MAG: ABC transporter ATP-binding protein [Thermomicrobiales bacterium]
MVIKTTNGAATAPHPTGGRRRDPGKVVLRTHALTKRFGSVLAVDGLDIDVRAGEVLGFLGPNGSGKSTTVGMILGLIKPTAGKVEFHDQDLARYRTDASVNRSIGAIIETPAFYPFLSGRDNLRALAIAAGGVPEERIDELLDKVGLTERAKSAFKTYSLGMKQRLGIASTLLTDPDLVILDEPTNGLDPSGQREVRELIPRLAREGRAVLLASHLLNEVEQVCDRVAIIRRGQLLQFGAVADLLRRGAFIEVVLPLPDLERAAAILRDLPFVGRVAIDNSRLHVVAHEEHGGEINRALANAGLYAVAIVPRKSRLEDVFLEMTEDETPRDERGAVDDAAAA